MTEGHTLFIPKRHTLDYFGLVPSEVNAINALMAEQKTTLQETDATIDGFNIGMNQGEVAGAGIAGHLHQHIVPRWKNDSNFFPIIAETKAIPRLLGEVREELAQAWGNS